jgi:hypothetical protein
MRTAVLLRINSWKGNGRHSLKILSNRQRQNRPNLWVSLSATVSAIFSKVSPLRRKALTISFRQAGKGIGQASRLTRVAADAGAMPRTASVLVIGEGFGDPRQRG